jgi:hypothetical protein
MVGYDAIKAIVVRKENVNLVTLDAFCYFAAVFSQAEGMEVVDNIIVSFLSSWQDFGAGETAFLRRVEQLPARRRDMRNGIMSLKGGSRYFAEITKSKSPIIPIYAVNSRNAEFGGISSLQCMSCEIGGFFRGLGCLFGRPHLADVDQEQTESGNDSKFFPKWGLVFAPIGIAGIWWSWDNIRAERRVFFSVSVFVASAILWMYGLARLITL